MLNVLSNFIIIIIFIIIMYILCQDSLSNIINNLPIYDILKLEQTNKQFKSQINEYSQNKYKENFSFVKKNLHNYYNEIDILTNLLNNNKNIFNNINLYYKSVNINYINVIIENFKKNYDYKNYILKILKFYSNIFSIIINNKNFTNIFFYKINRSEVNNDLYYIFINIKETFINFYKFLALYNYIKYFIYNNDNNYIKK